MNTPRIPRTPLLMTLLLAVVLVVAACAGAGTQDRDTLVVGFVLPRSGPYTAIGQDMRQGFDLYLRQHGGQLGGQPVRVVEADEADGGAAVHAGVDKLLRQDHATVIVGAASAPAVTAIASRVNQEQMPFVGVGGRPSTLDNLDYVWHTSFRSTDFGTAAGPHLAKTVDGPVYPIGPDYQGGRDQINGFVTAHTRAGGQVTGSPSWTPWPATTNFGPWLSSVPSHTGAVYAFYAGSAAVDFVRQHEQFRPGQPLYGPGFLTEGDALRAQGPAADGVRTVMPYAPGLPNAGNRTFVSALEAAYHETPTLYHVTSYDAATAIDRAVTQAGPDAGPKAINQQLGALGSLEGPRGTWSIASTTHTPVQRWYLREVQADTQGTRTNVVIGDLGTVGG